MFKNQADLEEFIVNQGRKRAQRGMEAQDKGGRASDSPYAKIFFRRFTKPLADLMVSDMDSQHSGKYRKAVNLLLSSMEMEAVALLAMKTTINEVMKQDDLSVSLGKLMSSIAKNIMGEILLRSFKRAGPEEYFYFRKALEARHSMDINYRMEVAKKRMKLADFHIINTDSATRQSMGMFIVAEMQKLDIVKIFNRSSGGKSRRYVTINGEIMELLAECREFIEEASPFYLPCVEKPHDWTTAFDGGFHSDALKKAVGQVIDARYGIKKPENIRGVLDAINHLQGVKWKINNRVYETARKLNAIGVDTDEIVSSNSKNPPDKPDFMAFKEKADFSEKELEAFKEWKKEAKAYHTQRAIQMGKAIRMNSLFNTCELFKDQPEMFFVYFADFRGRFYALTTAVNPQGSDLQKAVLCFADGKPIKTKAAQDWFFIHGANCFGVDKEPYPERIKWVQDNRQFILRMAEDPTSNRDWLNADKPFQFLAWCFEFKDMEEFGPAFKSHLAIGMDGSCNGLQHLSALLRDEVGGFATNLINSPKPQDIYGIVAKETEKLIRLSNDNEDFKQKFLKHGINRKLVKRSVMTMPYGSTRFSSANFILSDYMKVYKPIEFAPEEYNAASTWLSHIVWKAIANVVIKGRELMDWLQRSSAKILEKESYIEWETPNGLMARQDYREYELKEMSLLVCSELFCGRFYVGSETKKPDKKGHKNGIAPNFIHSMDAAHMQRVINKAREHGIGSLWMVHDDFGTHASDAEVFAKIIREEFVRMYEDRDPVKDLFDFYTSLGVDLEQPPEKGEMDIRQVIDSPYFFG